MPFLEILCLWIERCCFLNSETVTASSFFQINSEPYCALVQSLCEYVQLLDEVSLQSDQSLVCFTDKSEWARFNVYTPHTKPNVHCNSMNFHCHSICRLPIIGMVSCRILRSSRFCLVCPVDNLILKSASSFMNHALTSRFAWLVRLSSSFSRVARNALWTQLAAGSHEREHNCHASSTEVFEW